MGLRQLRRMAWILPPGEPCSNVRYEHSFATGGGTLLTNAANLKPQPPSMFAFDGFTFDLTRGVLTAEAREIVLRPKTAAVLEHLLTHAGHVVSRDALLTAVWGN